ncbi:MAG: sigma factor-like helix-turn-helix DNA-binding protein [Gemmatales bacterium]|nr:HPF/RaiA family ribosome-associated protein [Gemmatales bacterium]MDW8176348.1 sigma factor-like helix-turn-helix DNA-binding protein [Gemmatales bacterium]
MRTHVTFHHCDKPVVEDVEAYWEKKLPRIEHLLQHYAPDAVELRLTVWHHHQRIGYQARAVLHLPSGTLVADETAKDLHAALDAAMDTLVQNLKKHEEHIRRDDVYRRHRGRRADVSAAGPILQRDLEQGRHDAFFQLMRPALRTLRRYAQREIRLLELEGLLAERDWSVSELMDALISLAWQRFSQRPKDVAMDVWLMDLLHELLADWTAQRAEQRAEDMVIPPASEGGEIEPVSYNEQLRLEELVPQSQPLPSWNALSASQQHEKLLQWLSKLPSRPRQAFLLHVLEDYQPSEIAVILRRSEDDIRKYIEQARQHLIHCLQLEGYVQMTQGGNAAGSTGS